MSGHNTRLETTSIGVKPALSGDLVMGIINGYEYDEIAPFFKTLRGTSFSGEIVLFVGPRISARAQAKLESNFFVKIIRYSKKFPFVEDIHRDAPVKLPEPIHIYNYRHFLYLNYLLHHASAYNNVLVTDVKDVFFQADPFECSPSDKLAVAMERDDFFIADCPWTSKWMLAGYGKSTLEEMRFKRLSCAGTVLGPTSHVVRYLKLMLGQVQLMNDVYLAADQAAHNVLLHRGDLEPALRLHNFAGPILTLGTEPEFRVDEDGRLLNHDGSIVAVIHQFDRHPKLKRALERQLIPNSIMRIISKAKVLLTRRYKWFVIRLLGRDYAA